jgi:hypothetical protein
MSKREELISKSVAKLKSIQTIDNLKASGTTVPDIMESVFVSALEELKEIVERMDSVPDEEIQAKVSQFQDDDYLMPPEIGTEMERLEDIPGGFEYLDAFSDEMEKKIEALTGEYGVYVEKLANRAFGDMVSGMEGAMQGMADAMGEMAEQMGQAFEEDEETVTGYDDQNPEQTELLYDLYEAQSLEDLDKDALDEYLEDELGYIHSELDLLTDETFDGRTDDDMERIAEMGRKVERLLPEMEKEFSRLGESSDSADKANEILQDLTAKFSAKISEIKGFVGRVS